MTNLTILPSPPPEENNLMDLKDIESLDTTKLREQMMKGIYVLEAALFSQANFEYQRVGKGRNLLKQIEDNLFSEDIIKQISAQPELLMRLYDMLNKNMNVSLTFLQNLHNNIASGMDAIKAIEKEKQSVPREDVGVDANVDKVKSMIMAVLKEKLAK